MMMHWDGYGWGMDTHALFLDCGDCGMYFSRPAHNSYRYVDTNSRNLSAATGLLNRKPCASSHSEERTSSSCSSVSTPSATVRSPILRAMDVTALTIAGRKEPVGCLKRELRRDLAHQFPDQLDITGVILDQEYASTWRAHDHLPDAAARHGNLTTENQKSSIDLTTLRNESKPTGLVT